MAGHAAGPSNLFGPDWGFLDGSAAKPQSVMGRIGASYPAGSVSVSGVSEEEGDRGGGGERTEGGQRTEEEDRGGGQRRRREDRGGQRRRREEEEERGV